MKCACADLLPARALLPGMGPLGQFPPPVYLQLWLLSLSVTVFKNLCLDQAVRKAPPGGDGKCAHSYCVFGSVLCSYGGQLLKTVRGHICLRRSIWTENLEKLPAC